MRPGIRSNVITPDIVVEVGQSVLTSKEKEITTSARLGPSDSSRAGRGPGCIRGYQVIPDVVVAAEVVLRAGVFPHVVELCGWGRKAFSKCQTETAEQP